MWDYLCFLLRMVGGKQGILSNKTYGLGPYSSGVSYDVAAKEEYWGIVDIDRNKKLT